MANCPKCRTAAPWNKVLLLNKWDYFECESCGAQLRANRRRSLIILGIFAALMMFTHSMNLLPVPYLKVLTLVSAVLLIVAWVLAMKLDLVPENDITSLDNIDSIAVYHLCREGAENGNPHAQYLLGMAHLEGIGIARDLPIYEKLFRYVYSPTLLIVQQDYSEAAKWFRLAAEQGVTEAQHNLGVMYEKGQGVQLNLSEAEKWYRKAAEQGHAPAQAALGQMKLRSSMTKLEPDANQAPTQTIAPLPDRVPGQTGADELLQLNIVEHIAFLEGFAGSKGFQGRVLNTRRLTPSRELIPEKARVMLDSIADAAAKRGRAQTVWGREEWLIDRNGKNIYYEIVLIEGVDEVTDIVAGRVQEAPLSN